MGIQGLLPFVKKSSRLTTLDEFRGQTAAVDAYCWLHKGAFSCADKLVREEPTTAYVTYVMKLVNLLLSYSIKPVLVFDGCHLPSKAGTEAKRREKRQQNRRRAKELLREGKIKEARDCFQRCIDITPEMARNVIKACRERNVDTIVAPYEADAQLAFLNHKNLAQLVITEDSDLLLFGCSKVLFKLDSNGGGSLVEKEKLHLSMNLPRDKFSFHKFLHMCILSGCDYLPSLPGIGLAKACRFFSVTTNPDIYNVLCRLPMYLKMPSLEVTQEYRGGFMQAINTFLYQLVFDPITRTLRPLIDYENGMSYEDFPYAGKFIGHERGLQIALGNVDVQTGETVSTFDPEMPLFSGSKKSCWSADKDTTASHSSIWSSHSNAHPRVVEVPVAFSSASRKIVSATNVSHKRRKCEDTEETAMHLPSEVELKDMYGAHNKRARNVKDSADSNEESSLGVLSTDAKDNASEITDHSFHGSVNSLLTCSSESSNSLQSQRSYENLSSDNGYVSLETSPRTAGNDIRRNPFSKAHQPCSNGSVGSSGCSSALSKFTKRKKTVINNDTIVQSRYFFTSEHTEGTPKSRKFSVSAKEAFSVCSLDQKDTQQAVESSSPNELIEGENSNVHNLSSDLHGQNPKESRSLLCTENLSTRAMPEKQIMSKCLSSGSTKPDFKWGKLTQMFNYQRRSSSLISVSPASSQAFHSPAFAKRKEICSSQIQDRSNVLIKECQENNHSKESLIHKGILLENKESCDAQPSDYPPSPFPKKEFPQKNDNKENLRRFERDIQETLDWKHKFSSQASEDFIPGSKNSSDVIPESAFCLTENQKGERLEDTCGMNAAGQHSPKWPSSSCAAGKDYMPGCQQHKIKSVKPPGLSRNIPSKKSEQTSVLQLNLKEMFSCKKHLSVSDG